MASARSTRDKVVKRRGRPPGSRNSLTTKKQAPKPASPKKTGRTGRKPAPTVENSGASSRPAKKRGRPSSGRNHEPSQPAKARGRPSKSRNDEPADEPDEISVEQPQTQKYVQLAPRTRRIAQEKLDTWPQVPPQVLDQIVGMLRDAKKDIVNTQRDERRAMAAQDTLNILVRKLARQLSASRIPPQAKDIHFNIDKLTERYTHLFREVTTERHSKQLLKEQVKVAQHLLETDQENLEKLKVNAKQWKGEWKHQEKQRRLHPLLQDLDNDEMDGDEPDDIGLKPYKAADTLLVDFDSLNSLDPELDPLIEHLRRSLENMQGNHEQVAGIDEAMKNAQAALDDVLFRHASASQYAAL